MKPTVLYLIAVTAITGCATHGKFVSKMDGFVGQPERVIVSTYGPPQASHTLTDGSKVLQYSRGGQMVLPGSTTYQPVTTNTTGQVAVYQGLRQARGTYSQQSTTYEARQAPPTVVDLWCTVNFTIDAAGIVRAWSSSGNHCVAD